MSLEDSREPLPPGRRAFRLNKQNRKLWGVCAGIADYFDLDVTLVRIGWAVATVFGVGSMIIVYVLIALIAD